jgi:hypothetical protein
MPKIALVNPPCSIAMAASEASAEAEKANGG